MNVETVRRVTSHPPRPLDFVATEFQRAEHFVHREIAGEHLLIALRRDAAAPIFALTPTAAAIWDELKTWITLDSLVARVVEDFEVDGELAEHDVREFLEQLQMANALLIREGDA